MGSPIVAFFGGVVLWIVLFTFVISTRPQNLYRGKYLTEPLKKKWPRLSPVRLFQTLTWALLIGLLGHFLPLALTYDCYWIGLVLLLVDDYYADDDVKKKLKEVRNKIKWRMKLPAPVKVGSQTS